MEHSGLDGVDGVDEEYDVQFEGNDES